MGLINAEIASDLSCTTLGCVLAQPCSTYSELWTYSLMVQFATGSNYVAVNIGSIAIDNLSTG
jgi:hypothetical protein